MVHFTPLFKRFSWNKVHETANNSITMNFLLQNKNELANGGTIHESNRHSKKNRRIGQSGHP